MDMDWMDRERIARLRGQLGDRLNDAHDSGRVIVHVQRSLAERLQERAAHQAVPLHHLPTPHRRMRHAKKQGRRIPR